MKLRSIAAATIAAAAIATTPAAAHAASGDIFNPSAKLDRSQVAKGKPLPIGTCYVTAKGRKVAAARATTTPYGNIFRVSITADTKTHKIGKTTYRLTPVRGDHTINGYRTRFAVSGYFDLKNVADPYVWTTQYWKVSNAKGKTLGYTSCDVAPRFIAVGQTGPVVA